VQTLLIIGIIHSDNWRATAIAMGTFATGLRLKPRTDRENGKGRPFLEEYMTLSIMRRI
jgi:hypothetical protein